MAGLGVLTQIDHCDQHTGAMKPAHEKWICCQIGAREHYAVPRALHERNALRRLFTDIWVRRGTLLASGRASLRERFHPDLLSAEISSPNSSALAFEIRARLSKLTGWDLIVERNRWFQRRAVAELSRVTGPSRDLNLFAYSYAAKELLELARARGWRTVLGQIDAGPPEERIVAALHRENPRQKDDWQPAPKEYWDNWRIECELADHIVVNSEWSRDALIEEGISPGKLRVVPLAFETPADSAGFKREYPAAFSSTRPMRVLFLGQINLRKGVAPLLESVNLLRGEPIEFWMVGPVQISIPSDFADEHSVRWLGPVSRCKAASYYRDADVFVFPTFSDGFGLTQLEAQAWKLPVVASRFCGNVVRDGVNGVLVREVNADRIAEVLVDLAGNPERLREMAARSGVERKFSLESLGSAILSLRESQP